MWEITDEEFLDTTLSGTVLIYFSGDWCVQCGPMLKIIKSVEPEFPTIQFVVADVDASQRAVKICSVGAIPMLVLIRDGEIVKDLLGFAREGALREWLRV